MSDRPVTTIEPPVTEFTQPFWDATRQGELVLPWCAACERAIWYPREVCPDCGSHDIEWRAAAGDGQVYAVSVHYRSGPGRDPQDGPYAVALVELPQGVRLMSNVVGCPPEEVAVGMAVQLAWRPLSDGRKLPQFEPAQPV